MRVTLRNPKDLLPFLPVGHENAMTTRQLSGLMGWRKREITRAVQYLRLHGVPVLSDPAPDGGFWIFDYSENDLPSARMSVQSMRGRIVEQMKTVNAVEKAIGLDLD